MFEDLFGGKKKAVTPQAVKPTIQPTVPATQAALPVAGGTSSTGKDVVVEVEDLRKDVDKLKDSINALRGSLKSITDKMEEIEKNLGQLASIYELLTNQMNPFLDKEEITPPKPKKTEEQAPVQTVAPSQEKEEDVVLPDVDLTNPKVIQTILDWMQFIVERVGHAGVEEVLKYYVDIKWVSPEVAEILKRYADGIRVENEPEIPSPVQLDPEDHMKSLDYILQIKEFQG